MKKTKTNLISQFPIVYYSYSHVVIDLLLYISKYDKEEKDNYCIHDCI